MSRYRKLGELISLIDKRNKELISEEVLGINIDKEFMPSVANTIGTDLTNYKLIYKNIFACNPMHVGRDERLPVALYQKEKPAIVSPAYFTFRVNDTQIILPQFLMLIFRKADFDRNCWFRTDGSVRGGIIWADLCNIELPVPPIAEQQKIVKACNAITARIQLKQKINETLEKTAQCLFEELTKDLESNSTLSDIANITMGQSPSGDSYNEIGKGILFYQGKTDFGFRYVSKHFYTNKPTKIAKENDILLSVRAPVGDINITEWECCIGRGLSAINSKQNTPSFLFYTIKSLEKQFEFFNGEGTVFGSINYDSLSNLKIKLPQKEVITFFETKANILDKFIKNNCREIYQLVKMKELIIKEIVKR